MILHRYTAEVIYGFGIIPKSSAYQYRILKGVCSVVPALYSTIDPNKKLSRALKGKERTSVMVQNFGGKDAWDSFETTLATQLADSR